jgi:membrane-bound hydrogenase subunit beta
MNIEEEIQQELIKDFNFLEDKIRIPRARRIFFEVSIDKFEEVLEFLMNKINFNILCTMTGLDEGITLGVIYHLARKDGIMVNMKISVPKDNPVVKTITGYFPAAEYYEREIVDLLGAKVEGLPEGSRYPLPDGWPEGQYPLRKDWKSDMLGEEKNNG